MSRFIRTGKRTIHTVSPKEVKRTKRCVKKAEGMISKIAVKATKDKPLPPAPPTLDYTAEICDECGEINVFCWNIKKDGYAAHCLYCGEQMMLCDECRKDTTFLCDWSDDKQRCSKMKKEKTSPDKE